MTKILAYDEVISNMNDDGKWTQLADETGIYTFKTPDSFLYTIVITEVVDGNRKNAIGTLYVSWYTITKNDIEDKYEGTFLRKVVASGKPIDYLISAAVEDYTNICSKRENINGSFCDEDTIEKLCTDLKHKCTSPFTSKDDTYDFEDIGYGLKKDVGKLIADITDLINRYGRASIVDLFVFVGSNINNSSEFDWTNKYGWTQEDTAKFTIKMHYGYDDEKHEHYTYYTIVTPVPHWLNAE